MNYFITIIFISVSFGIQADLNNDYGPGSSDFKTDSSGSASAGYDKSVNDNPSRHSNENTGVSRSAPNDSPSSSSSTGSGSSSSNDRGHNHSDDRDDNDDNRNYGYGMDSNDPRSNGNGGYATSAYDITENANRSAHNQYSNNQGYHHEDPWSEYKQYDGGEFGHIGDYQAHEDAIQSAISSAESNCNGKCTGIDRIEIINEVYYKELSSLNSTLAIGPVETMAKYRSNEHGISNYNQKYLNHINSIDQLVRDGVVGAVLPGQFAIAYPKVANNLSPLQELGASGAVIITDKLTTNPLISGSFTPMESFIGSNTFRGAHTNYGGPGGTVFLSQHALGHTLYHELWHAGEQVVYNAVVKNIDTVLAGKKSLDPNQNFTIRIDNFEANLNAEQLNDLHQAAAMASALYLKENGRGHTIAIIKPTDCPSCNLLPQTNSYYNQYYETRAMTVTQHFSTFDIAEYMMSPSSTPKPLDPATARRVANELTTSVVIQDQIDTMDRAAQIVMDNNLLDK